MSTHNVCFHGEIRKISAFQRGKKWLISGYFINIFTFIDHKSKLTETDMLIFHFLTFLLKKGEKIYVSKIEFLSFNFNFKSSTFQFYHLLAYLSGPSCSKRR